MHVVLNRRDFLAASGLAALSLAADAPKADDLFAPIKAILRRKEPATWVFTGGSITHGALHTLGWRSYPEHFAERVRWEMRRMRDVVINTGISGDTVPGVLKDVDWRVLQFKPAVVSLMFGMNDCSRGPAHREAFRKDYITLVEKVRSAGSLPLLNTTNTILGSRGDLAAYNEIIREVAVATKTPLVDHFKHWQKERPTPEKLKLWIEDGTLHPGVHGHRALAHRIFKDLGIFDPKSPMCRLETP